MSAMPMPDAVAVNNGVYSDEFIELCAERYTTAGIGIRGVTFAQYVANPTRYDNWDRTLDPLPLNGKQRRVQRKLLDAELRGHVERVECEVIHLPRRNGRPMEVLHHHRYPRSVANFVPRKKP